MISVSVVIATYKRPDRLLRAVRSALAQTVPDLEIVVALERDDADGVAALAALADPRVRWVISPQRRGPGPARDLAARAATGRYIAFLDDDDAWDPAKLERQIEVAGEDTIVTCLSRVVTPSGEFIRPARPYDASEPVDEWLFARRSWFRGGDAMLQTSSLLMPRALFDRLGFGQSRHEEWELVIRAVREHGYRLLTVREPLVTYYTGGRYPWRTSVDWAEGVSGLVTPRALAGFCLNVATQGLSPVERNRAFRTLLATAFRLGKPEAKQLFAFFLIWVIPDRLRERLRAALRR